MPYEQGIQQVEKAYKLINESSELMIDAMLHSFLFTWKWWIGVGFIIIPWVLWFILREKESSDRLLYAGFVAIIISTVMDSIGVSTAKWIYPIKILPSTVIFIPFTFSLIPVATMFALQIKPRINPFIKAVVFGGLGGYVVIPLATLIDHYRLIDWRYTYSFIILTIIYLIAYWFSKRSKFGKI